MASNAPVPREGPLSSLDRIAPHILLYRPSAPVEVSPNDPKLIILATWVEARDVHIAKYLMQYQAIFPTSEVLIIKSRKAHFTRPSEAKTDVPPAVPVLRALAAAQKPTQKPKILIHLFSNGGVNSLSHLFDAYYEADDGGQAPRELPPHVTIVDSAPGIFSITTTVRAMSTGLPFMLKLFMLPVLYCWALAYWIRVEVNRTPDKMLRNFNSLNDESKNKNELRRCYVYSKADELIEWEWIERNIAEAREKGFTAEGHLFEKSPHVAHARTDPKRYWQLVRDTWSGECE